MNFFAVSADDKRPKERDMFSVALKTPILYELTSFVLVRVTLATFQITNHILPNISLS